MKPQRFRLTVTLPDGTIQILPHATASTVAILVADMIACNDVLAFTVAPVASVDA